MAPDEAYTAARRAFGNAMLKKEAARAIWIPAWWDHILQGHAVRPPSVRSHAGL